MSARCYPMLGLAAVLAGIIPVSAAPAPRSGSFSLEDALGYALDHSFAIR